MLADTLSSDVFTLFNHVITTDPSLTFSNILAGLLLLLALGDGMFRDKWKSQRANKRRAKMRKSGRNLSPRERSLREFNEMRGRLREEDLRRDEMNRREWDYISQDFHDQRD